MENANCDFEIASLDENLVLDDFSSDDKISISAHNACSWSRVATIGMISLFSLSAPANSIPDVKFYDVCASEQIAQYEGILDESRCQRIVDEKSNIENEILAMASLPDNWDCYGASAVVQKCIDNAVEILRREDLNSKYLETFPNTNGTVSFEWNKGDNCVGLEIGESLMAYFTIFDGEETYHDDLEINNANLIELMKDVRRL